MDIEEAEVMAVVSTARKAVEVLNARARAALGEAVEPLADIEQLTRDPQAAADEALQRLIAGDTAASLDLLNRVVQTLRWKVAIEQEKMPATEVDTGERPPSLRSLAGALAQLSIVQQSAGDADGALRSAVRAMEVLLSLPPDGVGDWLHLSNGLGQLVPHLNRLGHGRLALGITSAMVLLCTRAFEAEPSRWPRLLAALELQAEQHDGLGEIEVGLAVRRKAVEAVRGLGPAVTQALTTLGGRLADLGRGDEAAAVAREAQADLVELAPTSQAEASLELAERLAGAGRIDEAVAVGGQAIEVMRRRARDAESERSFARKLATWARILDQAGRPEAQVAALRELVDRLASSERDAYFRHCNQVVLALALWDLGEAAECHARLADAVAQARQLAAADPEMRSELVSTLTTQGQVFSFGGNYVGAMVPFLEALQQQEVLAEEAPEAADPELARCIFNLVIAAMGAVDEPQVLRWFEALLPVRRRVAERDPARLGDLVQCLQDLARFRARAEDQAGALAACQEAVELERPRVAAGGAPEALVSALAGAGSALVLMRRPEEARPFYDEALERLPACRGPLRLPAWRLFFEAGGTRLQVGDAEGALAALVESAARVEDPEDEAEVERGMCKVLTRLGREAEARDAMARAVALYEVAAQADPTAVERLRTLVEEYLELDPEPPPEMQARAQALGLR